MQTEFATTAVVFANLWQHLVGQSGDDGIALTNNTCRVKPRMRGRRRKSFKPPPRKLRTKPKTYRAE
jgi:hypothetical protein